MPIKHNVLRNCSFKNLGKFNLSAPSSERKQNHIIEADSDKSFNAENVKTQTKSSQYLKTLNSTLAEKQHLNASYKRFTNTINSKAEENSVVKMNCEKVNNIIVQPEINTAPEKGSLDTSLLTNALISSPFRKKSQTLSSVDRDQYFRKLYVANLKNSGINIRNSPKRTASYVPNKVNLRSANGCWVETIDADLQLRLQPQEIRRQEAIHEFYTGEIDTLADLNCLRSVYLDSLKCLALIKNEEIEITFRTLLQILPVHKEMIKHIESIRDPNTKIVHSIGAILYNWVSTLNCYIDYCGNLGNLRNLLEKKFKQEVKVRDFLERCQNSPFSRRLDIWSFIDLPRTRLVKYPLLFKQILKLTPETHEDYNLIKLSIKEVEKFIRLIDRKIGYNKCLAITQNLEYTHDFQKHTEIRKAQQLICSGMLKNQKGIKLQTFLFDNIFLMTRASSFNVKNSGKYIVYKRPIPLGELYLVPHANISNPNYDHLNSNCNNNNKNLCSTLNANLTSNRNAEITEEFGENKEDENDKASQSFNNVKKFEFRVQFRQRDSHPDTTFVQSIVIVDEHCLYCKDVHDLKMWTDSINSCIKLLKKEQTPLYK
ncbi:rho guanine nucleotide exchange factor 3-like [Gordionus sp. m RMFG-2023]|uniref:rho guanine nucleotide exchange factor 3-like n=1 Tax=Gordionus sp. m RMFG-2023 TaxID=3053472 RepID=UPI0031FC1DDA